VDATHSMGERNLMASWQVVFVFVAIPTALVCVISLTVVFLSSARVPDGIAAAQRLRDTPEDEVDATEGQPGADGE